MARMTGVSDQVVIKSGETEIEVGWLQSANYKLDNQTEAKAAIGGGVDYQYNLDGIAIVTGGFETNPVTLDLLKLMGTLSAGSITFGATLPECTVQMNSDDGNYVEIIKAKFSPVSIDIAKGEPMKVSFEFVAKDIDTKSGALDYTEPTVECIDFPTTKVKLGASYVGSVDSANISMDYGIEGHRGIENVAVGEIRKNTEVISKLKKIDFSMTIEITDGVAWTQAMGGTTISDTRTDTTITLETGGTLTGVINLTGIRVKDISSDKAADGEVRTAIITGTALGMTVNGLAT